MEGVYHAPRRVSTGILFKRTPAREDFCEYSERGLEASGVDCETPPPYLEALADPLESDGCVPVPQVPGMGYRLRMDYIEENRIR